MDMIKLQELGQLHHRIVDIALPITQSDVTCIVIQDSSLAFLAEWFATYLI